MVLQNVKVVQKHSSTNIETAACPSRKLPHSFQKCPFNKEDTCNQKAKFPWWYNDHLSL